MKRIYTEFSAQSVDGQKTREIAIFYMQCDYSNNNDLDCAVLLNPCVLEFHFLRQIHKVANLGS